MLVAVVLFEFGTLLVVRGIDVVVEGSVAVAVAVELIIHLINVVLPERPIPQNKTRLEAGYAGATRSCPLIEHDDPIVGLR
tara:strand:+ start:463 stop:705 length:243 start_codon:yes stop_codon:yes gene_type:complete